MVEALVGILCVCKVTSIYVFLQQLHYYWGGVTERIDSVASSGWFEKL
jgi:hypothetical protein